MARPKRGRPFDPATKPPIYDRRSTDLLRNAQVVPLEVDDPLERGATLIVMRSVRSDPLAGLHARKHIDEAQYRGGRAFQHDFEKIERGAQAVDPSKPYIDCSPVVQGASDAYSKALARLNQVHGKLGLIQSVLATDVLIHGMSIEQIAQGRGSRDVDRLGWLFRQSLDCLAQFYGFAMVTKV